MQSDTPTGTAELVKQAREAVEYMESYMGAEGDFDEGVVAVDILAKAADALEAAERVIAGVNRWIDDLRPYADAHHAPAPVFQACKDWLAAHATGQRQGGSE